MSADLDKAIDRAVRDMLDVEPPADLRGRVVDRIEQLPASGFRLPAAGWRFGVLAAAAAVVVVLAVTLSQRAAVVRPLTAPTVAITTQGTAPVRPAQASSLHAGPSPDARVIASVPERAARRDRMSATGTDIPQDRANDIAPLASITPIAIAPVTQESIAPADITIRPLTAVDELQIAPLTPPDRR